MYSNCIIILFYFGLIFSQLKYIITRNAKIDLVGVETWKFYPFELVEQNVYNDLPQICQTYSLWKLTHNIWRNIFNGDANPFKSEHPQ
jgi:hypothetical protein